MRRFLLISVVCVAGMVVLAVLFVLPSARTHTQTESEGQSFSVISIGGIDVPVVSCDFSVDPDQEIPDLWTLVSQPCSLETGWSRPVRRGALASADGAALNVSLDSTDWTHFVMRTRGISGSIDATRVEVRLNGTPIGSAGMTAGWQNIDFSIPAGLLRREVNRFDFVIADREPIQGPDPGAERSKHAFHLQKIALAANPKMREFSAEELRHIMSVSKAGKPRPAVQTLEPEKEFSAGPVRSSTGSSRDRRSDIVLITLDAARPDHFSCYGYDRPTTPNIDHLAEDSLVFTNTFALVPNTRRSVPTMVTGLSFINHQVTTDEAMLAEEATTLAEHLKEEGYRTACFSATPNNSRSLGADQGYDEFFELWTETSKAESMDPHYLSRRVVEWLESHDSLQPLHLQLHFIPPHAPYQPKPAFDLFTDPAYEGPCDGFPKSILWSDEGRRAPAAADLTNLVARYDGNLRAADDAVALVLAALQNRPNWSNTIVLVTSDHGEAFYEHRRLGHNNTVYDEMLRVPFILRMPRGFVTEGIDLDRLATLADIVPTLLAAISLKSDMPLDGIDLLAGVRPTPDPAGRAFAAQTAHPRPTRCLRSSRWKVVISNSGRGELYDISKDPKERRNLRFGERLVFLERGQLLTQRLLATPLLSTRIQSTDLPEKDREMLKALGYVD